MDIQVSSNFERLLFTASNRDGDAVNRMMDQLKQSGSFTIDEKTFGEITREFSAGRCDEAQTAAEIRHTLEASGYLLDPHTAVGLKVAREQAHSDMPMVTLATAHPAKFPDAVKAACGRYPELPVWQGNLMQREEHFTVVENDEAALKQRILSIAQA